MVPQTHSMDQQLLLLGVCPSEGSHHQALPTYGLDEMTATTKGQPPSDTPGNPTSQPNARNRAIRRKANLQKFYRSNPKACMEVTCTTAL